MKARSQKDFVSGLMFTAVGIAFAVGGSSYAYAWGITGNPVLPLLNATFRSPYFATIVSSVVSTPSCCSASQARRLLRHSQRDSADGSGASSTPSTRPSQVGSGVGPRGIWS